MVQLPLRKTLFMTQAPLTNAVEENCPTCGYETSHTVSIQLRTESTKPNNAEFSRQPYRVSECQICGTETVRRMNNT